MLRRYPSLLLLAGVLSGILIADISHLPSVIFLLSAIVLAVAGLWLISMRQPRLAMVVFAASLGAVTATNFSRTVYDVAPQHVSKLAADNQTRQIFGQVVDWPEIRSSHTEVILAVDSLRGKQEQRTFGNILLKITDTTTGLQRGDRIEFWGRIYSITAASNAPRFDYGRFLSLRGVFGVVYLPTLLDVRIDRRSRYSFFALTDELRNSIREALYADLSPQAAALASGFLIGETRNIPTGVYQAFRNSGTLHLMAVSGSNVAVVLAFFYLLIQPFGLSKGKRAVTMLLVVICFAALSYGEPSVLRASIMAALVLCATLLERRYDLNHITALAMSLILLFDPTQLYDVGFQLSFATAWGLIFIVPRLTPLFKKYHNTRWYRWLVFPVLISLVAQMCSAPLIAYYFGQVPVISLAANLVIVPLASAALVMILLVLLTHLLLPVLGMIAGSLTDLLLVMTLNLVSFFGGDWLPSVHFEANWPPLLLALVLGLTYLTIMLAVMSLQSRRSLRLLAFTLLLGANAGLALAAWAKSTTSGDTLHLATVPGGVSGLLTYQDGSADLMVSNLGAKPYATDEKVFLPMLREHGVKKLRRLFVLSAAYEAIDDLLRFADSSKAREIYVSADCERPCREVIRSVGWPDSMSARLRFFGGPLPPVCEGYNLGSDRISLWNRAGSVTLVSRPRAVPTTRQPLGAHVLVIGKPWKATVSDWSALRQYGYCQIVCPRIAQPVESSQSAEVEANQVPPDYICELQKVGELDLQVSDLSVVPAR